MPCTATGRRGFACLGAKLTTGAILPVSHLRKAPPSMPPRPIPAERQTRFPHSDQFGPRRYGLVQHRISTLGTAAPTHPVNQVPPPTKCSLFGSRYRICTWCPLIWRCFCHLGPCGALARCIGMILPMTDWSVTTDPPLGLTPPAQDLQGCPGSSRASTPPGSPPPGHGSGGGQPGSQRVEHRSTPPCGSGS